MSAAQQFKYTLQGTFDDHFVGGQQHALSGLLTYAPCKLQSSSIE